MLRLEPRPEPSRAMSIASPLIALAITVVIGTLLFVLLGKDPLRGLAVFFVEPVKSVYALDRAGDEGDAAAAHRPRPGGVLSLERLEHRRRGPVRARRDRGERRRHAGDERHRPLDLRAGAAGQRARRHGLGGDRGVAARPLQRQRDPGQPDARVRRRAGAQLLRLRPVEGSERLQLPADHHLPQVDPGAAPVRQLPRQHRRGRCAARGRRVLGAAVSHLRRLPAAGGRPGTGGGALRRLLVAQGACGRRC